MHYFDNIKVERYFETDLRLYRANTKPWCMKLKQVRIF